MTLHTVYVVLYAPPGEDDPELQGVGVNRLDAGQMALKAAENILGTAVYDEPRAAWIGDGGGVVVIRPVEFEWPVEAE